MKFTLSWLKEHLDTDATPAQIAERLTAIGLEVESVTDASAALKDFIVGEVVTAEKHPNADKLRLCSVSDGKDTLQIVCGAPNARAGIKVVLARPGTVIPATGDALKLGTIRGVESRGMMCSARELLLGEDHDGIIELKPGAKAGEPVIAALVEAGLLANDPLFDVSITPNRGDAASRVWHRARPGRQRLGHTQDRKGHAGCGQIPLAQKDHPGFRAREQRRLPDLRRPADPRRQERPRAQMGAGPAEKRGHEIDLRPGRCHQPDFPGSRPPAACVRCRQAVGQPACAHGQRP